MKVREVFVRNNSWQEPGAEDQASNDIVNIINSIDGAAQRTAFMNGEAAMMFDGSWAVASLDNSMADDMKAKVKLAPMPTVEGGVSTKVRKNLLCAYISVFNS